MTDIAVAGELDKVLRVIDSRHIFNGWLVKRENSNCVVNFQDGGRGGLPDFIVITEEDYSLAIAEKLNLKYMLQKYA
jgi:hypothetical protein